MHYLYFILYFIRGAYFMVLSITFLHKTLLQKKYLSQGISFFN